MKTKDAIKLGFGLAFGVHLFKMCNAISEKIADRYLKKRFDEDGNFRERIRVTSPELYARYRKESKDTTAV